MSANVNSLNLSGTFSVARLFTHKGNIAHCNFHFTQCSSIFLLPPSNFQQPPNLLCPRIHLHLVMARTWLHLLEKENASSFCMLNRYIFLVCRVFMGITSEQEHRGMTVQQGGIKVGSLANLHTLLLCKRSEFSHAVGSCDNTNNSCVGE